MKNTRNVLEQVSLNVDESMGQRSTPRTTNLSPVATPKDSGRRPLRSFGKVDVDQIVPDPQQPRTQFDEADIRLFSKSLRKHGQIHPIRVRWNESLSKWIILSGERRWRATQAAGLPTLDCCFVEGEFTESELREQQLVENLLRKDLKPLEEARAYQSLMDLNGWTGRQVSQSLHVTTSRISRALALLDLPETVQQQIEAGTLSKSSAYEISKLADDHMKTELATQAAGGKLSHAKTVKQIQQRRGKKSPKTSGLGRRLVFYAENKLKVTVSHNCSTSYHEVELALVDALEETRHRIRNNIKLF